MRRRNGFTLLELIIATTIIAMMSLLFVMVMTHSFWSQHAVREQTQEVLKNQKQIESELVELKARMAAGDPVETKDVVAFLPGHVVRTARIQVGEGRNIAVALVADYRDPVVELPKVSNAKTSVHGFDHIVKANPNVTDAGSLRLTGTFNRDNPHVKLIETFYWYVSVPGFNIPVPETLTPAEIESSGKYPIFPNQYTLIPVTSRNELQLSSLPHGVDVAGRHVIFVVSPAGLSGKIGEPTVSAPTFISAVPTVDRLLLRLDGSFVVQQKDRDAAGDLTKWTNLENIKTKVVSIGSGNPKHADQTDTVPFVADRVQFDANSGFRYDLNPFGGKVFMAMVAKGTVPETFLEIGAINGPKGIDAHSFPMVGKNEKPLAGGYTLYWNTVTLPRNANAIKIGGADVEVAELLLYNKELTPAEISAVETYLVDKYQPTVDDQPIAMVPDFAREIKVNETFSFPKSATAVLENGFSRNVPVEFVSGSYDTQTPGRYVLQGRAVIKNKDAATGVETIDRTKTFRLTLTVKKIPVESVAWLRPEFHLPIGRKAAVQVRVLPTDASYPQVKYRVVRGAESIDFDPNNGEVKGVRAGVALIEAISVDDPTKKATCRITVGERPPTEEGLIVHLDATDVDDALIVDPAATQSPITGWNNKGSGGDFFVHPSSDVNPQYIRDPDRPSVYITDKGSLRGMVDSARFARINDSSTEDSTIFVVSQHAGRTFEMFGQYEYEADDDEERLVSFGQDMTSSRASAVVFMDDTGQTNPFKYKDLSEIHIDIITFDSKYDPKHARLHWSRLYIGGADSTQLIYPIAALESLESGSQTYFSLGDRRARAESNFHEILIYDRVLSDAEKQAVVNYLRTKWDLR